MRSLTFLFLGGKNLIFSKKLSIIKLAGANRYAENRFSDC